MNKAKYKLPDILQRARNCSLTCKEYTDCIDHCNRILKRLESYGRHTPYYDEILKLLRGHENKLRDALAAAYSNIDEALALLKKLPTDEQNIMICYVLQGKNWEQVACTLFYSERQVFLLRNKALKHLSEIMLNRKENTLENIP